MVSWFFSIIFWQYYRIKHYIQIHIGQAFLGTFLALSDAFRNLKLYERKDGYFVSKLLLYSDLFPKIADRERCWEFSASLKLVRHTQQELVEASAIVSKCPLKYSSYLFFVVLSLRGSWRPASRLVYVQLRYVKGLLGRNPTAGIYCRWVWLSEPHILPVLVNPSHFYSPYLWINRLAQYKKTIFQSRF